MEILDSYILKQPHAQNVIDLFAGEWSSRMPADSGLVSLPGTAGLFEAEHIKFAEALWGGFKDRRILELGPLEGGHSYMFQRGGAAEVLAIEANTRAFMKCLCIKEIFQLDKVTFKLGDFVQYLEQNDEKFDIAIASGVLYHMSDPLRLLSLIAKSADRLLLWTHYYDEAILNANPKLRDKYSPVQTSERNGFRYQWAEQSYKDSLKWKGFCGGGADTSLWLTRQTILDFLQLQGFNSGEIAFEQPDHPHGPCFAVFASRV